jgi:hypothetical protein
MSTQTVARPAPRSHTAAEPASAAKPDLRLSARPAQIEERALVDEVDDVDEVDEVDEVGLESFPASDPPSWWAGHD